MFGILSNHLNCNREAGVDYMNVSLVSLRPSC